MQKVVKKNSKRGEKKMELFVLNEKTQLTIGRKTESNGNLKT
tara:strand:+ start:733 stop:858 length:126 start_codon:yes stop_codon:yes gene_type:complete